ncbi:hypothetical protein C8J56DRAFT_934424 [Mycena floridula]|nr:hypothetical protein C8J56DRAFT_934424 [Mycena floridula]
MSYYSSFSTPSGSNAFGLFMISQSPRDNYTTYEAFSQVIRPAQTPRKRATSISSGSSSSKKTFGLRKIFGGN